MNDNLEQYLNDSSDDSSNNLESLQSCEASGGRVGAADQSELAPFAEKHTLDYEYETRALDIVKKFVIERKRITFGGFAIDKALRLKGTKIYRDDEKPDIDIYSSDSVKDAYDLVDIFRKNGFIEVAAIRGAHLQTMRVRTNFIYVIDIGYIPPEIYETIPTINFNGILIVHPLYQRMDMYLSFSFPYSGVPRENVSHRWEKDMKRHKLLDDYYPVTQDKINSPSLKKSKISRPSHRFALFGFAAYGAIHLSLNQLAAKLNEKIIDELPNAPITANEKFLQCESPESNFVIISPHNECDFASYGDKLPGYKQTDNCIEYSSYLSLLAICSVKVNDIEFLCVNIYYVMLYMLVHYFKTGEEYYLSYYLGAVKINEIALEIYKKHQINIVNTPFSLCTDVIGDKNMDISYLVRMAKNIRITRDLENYPKYIDKSVENILKNIPSEYYDQRPELFNYKESTYFYRVGQKL